MYEKIGQATDRRICPDDSGDSGFVACSIAPTPGRRTRGVQIVINAVIDALRINHDNVWRDAAVKLSAIRTAPPGLVTGSSIRNAIQCRTVLQNDVHQCVVKTLQTEIDAVFRDAIASNRQALVATRLSRWPCSRVVDVSEDNRSAKISSRKLYLLAVDDIFAATGVKLEVKLDRGIDEITFEDLLRISGDVKTFALSVITYISMKSGSVRLVIEIKAEDAKRLTRLFTEGRLKTLGGISVAALGKTARWSPVAGTPDESSPVMLDLENALTNIDRQSLTEFIEHEKERARQAESWLGLALSSILDWLGRYRRLHRLSVWARITLAVAYIGASVCRSFLDCLLVFFPHRLGTPETLGRLSWSASRWFAASWSEVNRIKLREDSVNAFVIWPLLTGLSIAAILLTFAKPGLPVVLWSSASGTVLSVAGGLVCAAVLSIRACGAAGVVLGTAFGVVQGLIAISNGGIGGIANVVARSDAFTRIVGGLVAVDAPRSLGSNLTWALVALGIPAIGIACAAKLMARPLEVADEAHPGIWRETIGALLGSSAGVGIFILMKSTELLSRIVAGRSAFLIAYAFVNIVALACLFRLRVVSATRVGLFALVFLVSGSSLVVAALWSPVGWPVAAGKLRCHGHVPRGILYFGVADRIPDCRVAGWRGCRHSGRRRGLRGVRIESSVLILWKCSYGWRFQFCGRPPELSPLRGLRDGRGMAFYPRSGLACRHSLPSPC